jgi:phasin
MNDYYNPSPAPFSQNADGFNNPAQYETTPMSAPIYAPEIVQSLPEQAVEIGEAVQHSAEAAVEQARTSFDTFRLAAEEARGNVEAAIAAASAGVNELNSKAFDAFKSSTDAAMDYVRALSGAKTYSDVVAVQTEHMRKQVEAMHIHSREFAELATKVSARAFAPFNETFAKTFGTAA